MKICFMCDLHLPPFEDALQYDVLDWAVVDISKKKPDCIVYAGDVTCDGNEQVYDAFIEKIKSLEIPFLYVPGNSDLRSPKSRASVLKKVSPCKNVVADVTVFALNDADRTVSESQLRELEDADENSIVFMHHPFEDIKEPSRASLIAWRDSHKDTMLFYAHLHRSMTDGNSVSLQAMDPDKAIGENPCVTYYDTETGQMRKSYYFCPVPVDIYDYFGISCYDCLAQIELATDKNLKYIELRPNCVDADTDALVAAVAKWRAAGGEQLSIHLPDIGWDGGVVAGEKHTRAVELVKLLGAERVTQHVPKMSVRQARECPESFDAVCDYLSEQLNGVEHALVVGIENMHMTAKDCADDTRRFGYLPEECIEFMQAVAQRCKHKVGINFDIGHARNNAPYSKKYQIGTWLSLVGKYAVGYHIHQVTPADGRFENHTAIDNVYGELISFASFFRSWTTGRINKAPFVLEMRPRDAYEKTLKTFDEHKARKVFDMHSHTNYSRCGRDDPHVLIRTAINNGISVLGICDHNYGIGERKAQYIAHMRELAREYSDRITLRCGIEIATLPQYYDINDPKEIESYDYCLIEHLTDDESIVKDKLFEFCDKLGIVCGIAHTDMFAYCDKYGFDYAEFFARLARNNIFWEMNVSFDSTHKYREHKYVADFVGDERKQRIIKDAGVCISVGFDSHRHEDYDGHRVYQMYDFLKSRGIRTVDELFD